MTGTHDVIGVGVAVHDVTMELDSFPREDTKAVAGATREGAGGPVVRAGVALSRLGRSVGVLAALGGDPAGDAIEASLASEGIGRRLLVRTTAPTRRAHVWTSASGTRTIAYSEGGPSIERLIPEAVEALGSARAVLFDGRELAIALLAAERAVAASALLTLDLGASVKSGVERLAARCAVVLGPAASIERAGGSEDVEAAARRLIEQGADLVVVTAGADGARAFDTRRHWHQPAFVVDVVDSNGAGDAFHGGLVDALLDGADHGEAVRRAAAVAALKVSQRGDAGLPDREHLERFLRERSGT